MTFFKKNKKEPDDNDILFDFGAEPENPELNDDALEEDNSKYFKIIVISLCSIIVICCGVLLSLNGGFNIDLSFIADKFAPTETYDEDADNLDISMDVALAGKDYLSEVGMQNYLEDMGFSEEEIQAKLVTISDSTWNEYASNALQIYMNSVGVSEKELVPTLENNGFTQSQIDYILSTYTKIDYTAQCRTRASVYLSEYSLSRSELKEMLLKDGFTKEQIDKAFMGINFESYATS